MSSEKIPIFLSSDNNYAPLIATTIMSICKNTQSFCEFFILDGGISDEYRQLLFNMKKQYDNFNINFINIDTQKYFQNFIATDYISVATYYRFIISELISEICKALYLDVDIIVNGDIKKLFNENLDEYIIGAIPDNGNRNYVDKLKSSLSMSVESIYFNAGILLIDFSKWKNNHVTDQLFQIEKKYRGKLICNDQDVLNLYFENNYKILDKKYNSNIYYDNCIIRHYYGCTKPWHFHPDVCIKELEEYQLFWNIARDTPFYDILINKCTIKSIHTLHLHRLIERQRNLNYEKSISNNSCLQCR